MLLRLVILSYVAAVAVPSPGVAAEGAGPDSEAGIAFFESKIRPVLVKHCYECHSAESGAAEGGLQLDSRKGIRDGGEGGPAVVPGDPRGSRLLVAVSHTDPDLQMPPKQQRLPDAVLADLKKWIEMGAPDPRDGDAPRAAATWGQAGRDFWAYQPPRRPALPQVEETDWPTGDLDRFVLDKLRQHDLAPSPDAAPGVLLRRLHFDLVGLPPSDAARQRFSGRITAHGLETALATEVDALLASPQFGERWGRHWLDVARFGESSGKEANISFPDAWRYRDYVIDCLNADVPFDRFVMEQIAGDLLPYDGEAERARLLIATGFLAIGPKNLDEANPLQFHADVIDEQIDTLTRAVTASSVACARCHDHKFDPFSMDDYYALAGIFASTKTYFGTAVSPANRMAGDPLPLPAVEGQSIFHRSIPAERVASLKAELAALEQEQRDGMAAVYKAIAAGEDPGETFTLRDALRIFWRSGAIEGQLEKVSETGEALPLAMGVLDRDEIIDAPRLERGEVGRPGPRIPRGFPQAIAVDGEWAIPSDQSGRLELAQWLTHPDHPLTSRVIVNRIWRHLFGAGLVRTVDHFGSTGERPSHPELLDELAVRFVENGWSIKRMVREIVLSRTYRQASTYRDDAFRRDPDNRLLWRVSKRRLEAEAIRDAMLAVAGELDPARPSGSLVARVIGDRPISLIGLDKRLPADLDGSTHRSVYLPAIRDRLPDVLDLFDFAEPSLVTGDRETTNVPVQALYLMNSPFVRERAAALAARVFREADGDDERICRAFALCLGREPEAEEHERAVRFLIDGRPSADGTAAGAPPALVGFCQALLSTAEFRNLD
ncbi:MAG TPA: DUF1553 domain-containing protein [Planctomycetaceae bacterium]|nr:DUF1553 domain-containing protein [Planctomycetaceae bacterium]